MGGSDPHEHGHVLVHDLTPPDPAHARIVSTLLYVFAVVATPRHAVWAFGLHAALILWVIARSDIRLTHVARRLVLEAPFVAFAVFLPFIGRGDRVDVLGLSLSVAGLWASWNILIKGSLGVMAAVTLASTTSVRDLLLGLERLRMPSIIVQICGFMVRYGEVITGEMHRMRIARESRGYDPRWIWQARAIATSAGALFIRSYERGERVYLAMQSRGYDGSIPDLGEPEPVNWVRALFVPFLATVVMVVAWL